MAGLLVAFAFRLVQAEVAASSEVIERDPIALPRRSLSAPLLPTGNYDVDIARVEVHQSGKALHAAIDQWMGWTIGRQTSRETDIPRGLTYLTGFVINEGLMAEEEGV